MPYYRRNLYVLWLTTFLAAASWTQVVPFLPLYLSQLGVTDNLSQWSGAIFSLQFVAGVLMAPFWGRIADRRGRKLMTLRAGFCLSAIYILTGLATRPWHVAVLRFLNGALTGFIPGSMALVATNTPKELSARYVASLQTASAAGSIVGPVIGGALAEIFGIRGALFVSGCVVLFATLLVLFLVQEPNKVAPGTRTTLVQDIRTALQMPAMLTVMGITFLAMLATIAVQPILAIYVGELSASPSTTVSGIIFSIPGLAFVVAAGRWVRVGERFGHRTAVQWAIAGSALFGVALSFVHTLFGFAVLFFGQGLFLAGLRPAASAIISTEVESSFQGRAFGMQSSANMLAGMFGPLISGWVSGAWGTSSVFWVIGLLLIVGGVLLRFLERAAGAWVARDTARPYTRSSVQ